MNNPRIYSELSAVDPAQNTSLANTFSTQTTTRPFDEFGELKEMTPLESQGVVIDIVDEIFESKRGAISLSSSQCNFPGEAGSGSDSEDMDKRLKLWRNTLRDRVLLQRKISKRIGRRPEEMLINLPLTEEQRDRGNIQRLMDFATRLNPTKRNAHQLGVLPAHCGKCVPPVRETLPRAERLGHADIEITGLTRATRLEMEVAKRPQVPENCSKWLNSKELEKGISEQARDITRVLEFYPIVEGLEVVGVNPLENPEEHIENIDLVKIDSIYSISSSTHQSYPDTEELELEEESKETELKETEAHINVGLKINEQTIILDEHRAAPHLEVRVQFECIPFECQLKQVVRLENVGRQIFACDWQQTDYYKRLMKFTRCNSFRFNHRRFKLFPGDVHIINAIFQPRTVCLSRQQWELKIFPNIFCSRHNALTLVLEGKCDPSPEYTQKLDRHMRLVVDKSIDQVARQLAQRQAELVPLLQPTERLCPYERAFDERELFNAQNPGYRCERFDDLEQLRAQYNVLKWPREPAWDLRLETIKAFILRLPDAKKRESFFERYRSLEQTLICSGHKDALQDFQHNSERERSRFVYVRGCIGNGFDEWQDLMMSLEQSCLRSELTRFNALQAKQSGENEEEEEDEPEKSWLQQLQQNQPELYVLRQLRSKKYFRDSLYMLTYSHLCDMAENVVSIIESTEFI